MLQVELQWGIERLTLPTQALCQKWVDASLLKEDHSIELTIRIVSAQESQALNKAYRHKDKPTNVLSFEFEPPIGLPVEALEGGGEKIYLGDLAICAEVVKQEALAQHKTLEAHWAHMIVHGALHLQGLDHIEAEDALEMEALEIKIMHKLGYANPYEI